MSDACLLDANVLIALAWPQHVHHGLAHDWFRRANSRGWATCATTELAFVRISANPRITVEGVSVRTAIEVLGQITRMPGHRFLADAPSLTAFPRFHSRLALGHAQVTDLYLLEFARHHDHRLATLDRGIGNLLVDETERRRWIELLH